ncbi:unnamed protein product [Caenorhabditis angaria]|uniref:PH domain-containing protein n=1 Tax=Caenorhabditis angaria TaxID=860376 RepID=A0A9P1MZK4_9PELO|nr:unnamed protein product [Caenorhabditis angaria]
MANLKRRKSLGSILFRRKNNNTRGRRMSTTSRRSASISSNQFAIESNSEKSGWLQKWTNYIKGYRQRWFVLDSNGMLSYYRSPNEVGHTCRGSVNMQEARLLLDKSTSAIVISAASQTFHVKAHNEEDKKQWIQKLNYARHNAITRAENEEAEDARLSSADLTRSDVLLSSTKELVEKIERIEKSGSNVA